MYSETLRVQAERGLDELRVIVGRHPGEIPVEGEAVGRALESATPAERRLLRTCLEISAYEMMLRAQLRANIEVQARGLALLAAAAERFEAASSPRPVEPAHAAQAG